MSYQRLRKKTLNALTQKRQKKKKLTKKELRGIKEEDKIFEEQCSYTKTIFDWSEGIEPRIEKALKIGSTN